MTTEQTPFVARCVAIAKAHLDRLNESCDHHHGLVKNTSSAQDLFDHRPNLGEFSPDVALVCSWHVGGKSGGSCWGGTASSYTTDVEEPDFELLDLILTEICPQITLLQHKALSKLIRRDVASVSEYYGNCTDHSCKLIGLRDVETFLTEHNLV